MDLARKLQILEAANFSEIKMNLENKIGFGILLGGIVMNINVISRKNKSEIDELEMIRNINKDYNQLVAYYQTIPFDEMDRSDEDFAYLFDFREGLEELGTKLSIFLYKCLHNPNNISRDWSEYSEVNSFAKSLYTGAYAYRHEILVKHNIWKPAETLE